MKWGKDFFSRKTPEIAPVQATENEKPRSDLELLHDEINLHSSRLASLQREAAEADAQLAEIGRLATALKIRISEHDSNATAALDSLEREELALRRVRSGLATRIQSLEQDLAPMHSRAAALALARDAIRQDEFVTDLTRTAESQVEELLASWRKACSIGFDLMSLFDAGMLVNLDEEHKRRILLLNADVGKKLFQASLEQVNARWQFARPDAFHSLKVLPGRPRRNETSQAG